jgi:Zn-dependent peptidase ImmA (M78 family)
MGAEWNSNALRRIREQRRFTIPDVASFAKITEDSLLALESGAKPPSRKQIGRLALTYGVPEYAFFSNRMPNLPDTPQDFRKNTPSPADLSPSGMKSLWRCINTSHFGRQLQIELDLKFVDRLRHASTQASIAKQATEIRQIFDSWLNMRERKLQLSGHDEQRIFLALRLFIESQGCIVANNDAPPKDYMGLFMSPEGGLPIIFVNRSILSKKAQLFTLVHEYAHALLKRQGVSNPFVVKNEIERKCNEFAAEFLAPARDFRILTENKKKSGNNDVFDLINSVSSQSLLSKHATAIRLLELDFISRAQLRAWEMFWRRNPKLEKEEDKEEAQSRRFGQPHAKRLSELGYLTVYLASEGIKRKMVDSLDVRDAINLSETLQQRAFALAKQRFEVATK